MTIGSNRVESNMERMLCEAQEKRKSLNIRNRSIICEAFTQIGLSHVSVHFDGSNDSGLVEWIETPCLFALDLKEVCIVVEGATVKLYDFLEDFSYEILSDKVGGWEINAGSFGSVIFHQDGNAILEFNGRIEDTYYEEHSVYDLEEVI